MRLRDLNALVGVIGACAARLPAARSLFESPDDHLHYKVVDRTGKLLARSSGLAVPAGDLEPACPDCGRDAR